MFYLVIRHQNSKKRNAQTLLKMGLIREYKWISTISTTRVKTRQAEEVTAGFDKTTWKYEKFWCGQTVCNHHYKTVAQVWLLL
jgi:hypothetical protein